MIIDSLLLQEIVKGGLTWVAAFIGFWLALRSYRYNQWWDTRRQTYQKAVQVLYECSCAFKKRTILSRTDPNKHPDKRVEIKDADNACHNVAENLERLIHEGIFNMSPQALSKLQKTVNVISDAFKNSKRFTRAERWAKACYEITKLEKDFATIAKDDLKVGPLLDRKRRQLMRLYFSAKKRWKSFLLNKLQPLLLTIWFGVDKARRMRRRALA